MEGAGAAINMDSNESIAAILGYLNFSHGTPSPKFQRSVDDLFRACASPSSSGTWKRFFQTIEDRLGPMAAAGGPFPDVEQARRILAWVRDDLLPAYRAHHLDLLAHLSDDALFQPFFLARVFECALALGGPAPDSKRTAAALARLNDYLGHRPIAVLENERKIEPYEHERVRPIPLFLEGAGVATGPYQTLIERTLEILGTIDSGILQAVYFDMGRMAELALDPRAFDHAHPATQRPGYQFGEWDPHLIDNQGYYRRFILRPIILDALVEWRGGDPGGAAPPADEALFESAAALAGTILLASGVSGAGPDSHGSDVNLATLIPRIARCRDQFYEGLLARLTGPLGERLRAEAARARQPFGGVRQFLNHTMARTRATQLKDDHLSRLIAAMGYPEASRRHSSAVSAPSARLRAELVNWVTAAEHQLARGDCGAGLQAARAAEDILHRAIECGAFVDPWNILGFQGNYPLFASLENSVTDPRVEFLLADVRHLLDLHGAVLREASARGAEPTARECRAALERLADWWDQFATIAVRDVPRVSGSESARAAVFVASALAEWRRSQSADDVAFWKRHAGKFDSPRSFASVVDALLARREFLAAMALLMQWLSQVEQVPLEDGDVSFASLARRWVASVVGAARERATAGDDSVDTLLALLIKFFDYLEVNADEYWRVPGSELFQEGGLPAESDEPGEEDLFAAAYEGITFRDSADDGRRGEMIEGPGFGDQADRLAEIEAVLEPRLAFQGALARLWRWAAEAPWTKATPCPPAFARQVARGTRDLVKLMDYLHDHPIPAPTGAQESMVEYDQRQTLKERLLSMTIAATIESARAARRLAGLRPPPPTAPDPGPTSWEPLVIHLERAARAGAADQARALFSRLERALVAAPLLYVPLDQGGHPRAIFLARYARDSLRGLAIQLPRLGLFRETYSLLQSVLEIEQAQAGSAQQVTEFNLLFLASFRAVIESLVALASGWDETKADDQATVVLVGTMVGRFSRLWIRHVSAVRLSELERRSGPEEWDETMTFIRRHGRELFTQKFMTFANLRGILHHGARRFLDDIAASDDERYPKLASELGGRLDPAVAATHLEFILRAVLENYEAYKDYNSTTTQSDYGENLYLLLELMRLKARYERHRWALEPAYIAHSVLARQRRPGLAPRLELAFHEETAPIADQYLRELDELEQRLGMRLLTIRERLGERFTRPLALDRILALVRPAMRAADRPETAGPFADFERLLQSFASAATGAGLDVPNWLEQLEEEVERARRGALEDEQPDEEAIEHAPSPAGTMTYAEFERQLAAWGDVDEDDAP